MLSCALLAGCGGGDSQVKQPDESGNEFRNTDCEWGQETTSQAFSRLAADRVLKNTIDRAWSCGLDTKHRFDLSLNMSWGPSGCVARIRFESEVTKSVRECLLRHLESVTVPTFGGASPSVQVHMTNDRAWWNWL